MNPFIKMIAERAGKAIATAVAVEGIRVVSEHVSSRYGDNNAASRMLASAHVIAAGSVHHTQLAHHTTPQCATHAAAEFEANNFGSCRQWAEMGEKQGDGTCMAYLGILYLRGWGVSSDPLKSTGYFLRAADAGERRIAPVFIESMAASYATGNGAPQDEEAAVYLFKVMLQIGNQQQVASARTWLATLAPQKTIG
jgi:TPR repeat protein